MKDTKETKPLDSTTFDRNDISAVANNRYFRTKGLKTLIFWAIITFIIVALSRVVSIAVDDVGGWVSLVSYACLFINALVFITQYSKGQTEIRVKLWERIEAGRLANKKETDESSKTVTK
jgi:hypothetical protein